MNKQIEDYICKNYYSLLSIAKKITKEDNQFAQDLLQFIILELYEKDDIKLKSFDNDSIKYYITAIMRINFNSKTSPWHYKMMRDYKKYSEIPNHIYEIEDNAEELFHKELIIGLMEIEYVELSWFHKSIIDL